MSLMASIAISSPPALLAATFRIPALGPEPWDLGMIYDHYGPELSRLEQIIKEGPFEQFRAGPYSEAYLEMMRLRQELGPALEPVLRASLGDEVAEEELSELRLTIEVEFRGRQEKHQLIVASPKDSDDLYSRLWRQLMQDVQSHPDEEQREAAYHAMSIVFLVGRDPDSLRTLDEASRAHELYADEALLLATSKQPKTLALIERRLLDGDVAIFSLFDELPVEAMAATARNSWEQDNETGLKLFRLAAMTGSAGIVRYLNEWARISPIAIMILGTMPNQTPYRWAKNILRDLPLTDELIRELHAIGTSKKRRRVLKALAKAGNPDIRKLP